jgi:hypothetical protein
MRLATVPRRLAAELERLHGARAYQLWLYGRGDTVTFAQAVDFWGGASGVRVVPEVLQAAGQFAGASFASGMVLDLPMLSRLTRCSEFLAGRFGRRLAS